MRMFACLALLGLAAAIVVKFAREKRLTLARLLSAVLIFGIIGAYARKFLREFSKTQ